MNSQLLDFFDELDHLGTSVLMLSWRLITRGLAVRRRRALATRMTLAGRGIVRDHARSLGRWRGRGMNRCFALGVSGEERVHGFLRIGHLLGGDSASSRGISRREDAGGGRGGGCGWRR